MAAALEAVNGPTEPLLNEQVFAMVADVTGLQGGVRTPETLRVNGL